MALNLVVTDGDIKTSMIQIGREEPLENLLILIEVELEIPLAQQAIVLNGQPLNMAAATVGAAGVNDQDMLLVAKNVQAGGRRGNPDAPRSLEDMPPNLDPAAMVNYIKKHPHLLKEMAYINPDLADALKTEEVVKVRTVIMKQALQVNKKKFDKDQAIAKLNADPFNVDAQKKIEEMVRLENVQQNMEMAMEEMPEAFGRVFMLYIDAEVNGVPIKAFVDSGAQSTIMSVNCAERTGMMRLLDTRFAGMASGVGTARILGRIHIAQLKIGPTFFPCTFTVLEKNDVDFLFGLDMLKRHQCVIDLRRGVLQLGSAGVEVPFLTEKDLPASHDGGSEEEEGKMHVDKTPRIGEGAASASGGGGGEVSSGVQELLNLGFTKEQAEEALRRTNGDVSFAASLLLAESSGDH